MDIDLAGFLDPDAFNFLVERLHERVEIVPVGIEDCRISQAASAEERHGFGFLRWHLGTRRLTGCTDVVIRTRRFSRTTNTNDGAIH
jgi:hypothetical protein